MNKSFKEFLLNEYLPNTTSEHPTSLRLLLFSACNRNCEKCCNKQYDIENLPVCHKSMYKNFRSVVLTGGEPMLRPGLVTKVADNIKAASQKTKVYLYTAKVDDLPQTMRVLRHIDGITLTLHEQKDVEPFKRLQDVLLEKIRRDKLQSGNVSGWRYANDLKRVVFRLNVFHGVDIRGVDTTGWQVKTMRWQDDCPVPKDEILMKYDMQKSDNATGAFPAIKETYGNYAFNNCICACIY